MKKHATACRSSCYLPCIRRQVTKPARFAFCARLFREGASVVSHAQIVNQTEYTPPVPIYVECSNKHLTLLVQAQECVPGTGLVAATLLLGACARIRICHLSRGCRDTPRCLYRSRQSPIVRGPSHFPVWRITVVSSFIDSVRRLTR